jgi:hypothetical protein
VSDQGDVLGLSEEQRDLRCIDCDAATLEAIGQRFVKLDYLFINDASRITDRGVAAVSGLNQLHQQRDGNHQVAESPDDSIQ